MDEVIDMLDMDIKWTELVMEELVEFMDKRKLSAKDMHMLVDALSDEPMCPRCFGRDLHALSGVMTGYTMCNECKKVW